MTEKSKKITSAGPAAQNGAGQYGHAAPAAKPDWATGLRRLYDSVVEEPLPDSFKDLLSKLDDASR